MPGQTIPANVPGNTFADIPIQGMIGRTVAVTNPGSSWVHFPATAGACAWVPPRYYGVIFPCPTPYGSLRVDLTQTPSAAYPKDASDLTAAQITIHEDDLPFSPGQSLLSLLPTMTTTPNSFLVPTRLSVFNLTGTLTTQTYDTAEVVNAAGAVLYWDITALTAGTLTFTISMHDLNTGADLVVATSPAIAVRGTGVLYAYPGVTPVANVALAASVGHTPRVTVTPAGGAGYGLTAWMDLLA